MEKRCSKCNRIVQETVHTAKKATVDYFETHKKGETTVTCVNCLGSHFTRALENVHS